MLSFFSNISLFPFRRFVFSLFFFFLFFFLFLFLSFGISSIHDRACGLESTLIRTYVLRASRVGGTNTKDFSFDSLRNDGSANLIQVQITWKLMSRRGSKT